MSAVARSGLLVLALAGVAEAKPLAVVGHVAVENAVIDDAFALDDVGRTLAWIETTGAGNARLHVDPVGGKRGSTVDLTDFTVAPEHVYFVGGSWFVVAGEGERRSAAVVAGRRIATHIGPFGEAVISQLGGRRFVTVTQGRGEDRAYTIAAYRPNGHPAGQRRLAIGADGALAGTPGLSFIGFTNGYLQALVKKPGSYDRRSDTRGPAQLAVYDVLAGRAGPGKSADFDKVLDFAAKRAEQPGAEVFIHRDEGQGFELVGPGDRARRLVLPAKLGDFAPAATLPQQAAGGQVIFSLVRDGITDDVQASGKKGPRQLAFFAVDAASAKVTALGEVPLDEEQEFAWAAGGNRIAVLRKTQPNAGPAIDVYQR